MARSLWLAVLLASGAGCATSSDLIPIDYEFHDYPKESRFELVYRNDTYESVCLAPEAWPDSKGLIAGSPQVLVLVIGKKGFPVTAESGFWGHCDPVDECLLHVAPNEALSVSIPYSSFTIPEELLNEPKWLDFETVGMSCPPNARK